MEAHDFQLSNTSEKYDDLKHFALIKSVFDVHCKIPASQMMLREKAWDNYISRILNFGIDRIDWSVAASLLVRMCRLSSLTAYRDCASQLRHGDVSLDHASLGLPLNMKQTLADFLIDENWHTQFNSIEIEEWWDLVTENLTPASRQTLRCVIESGELAYNDLYECYPDIFTNEKHADNRMYVLRKELKRNLEAIQAICPSPI
jgi:hypothetical protein